MRYTAEIAALGSDGEGIGPITGPEGESVGRKVLVPGTIPGESVEIELDHSSPPAGLGRGELVHITKPDPSRRSPPCKYVPECGGCALQHMQVAKQRAEKLRMVESLFVRQAKLEPRTGYSIIGRDLPEFYYRNRILLHLNPLGELGFYRSGSGTVVDIESCLLAEARLNELVVLVRPLTKELAARVAAIKFERRTSGLFVLLKPRDRGGELDREIRLLSHIPANVTHDEQNESDAGHFSQVNSSANEILTRFVVEQFGAVNTNSKITEFYAGAGNFTFLLAEVGWAVEAVEIDVRLVEAAITKATVIGVSDKVTFINKSCEKFCRDGKVNELVLLDPPRAGAKIVAERLSPSETKQIVYVSCNPATLARDLKILVGKGFVLEHVAVLDMFSQTAHVETIAILRS